MKLQIKDCESHLGSRREGYVLFLCELVLEGKTVATSDIWCSTEQEAIDAAFSSLARKGREESSELTRTNYEKWDLEMYGSRKDPWGQIHREPDPERRESMRKTWQELLDAGAVS